MNIEDVDIYDTLKEYKDHIGYIHFCDSNRLAPGKGHLDFYKTLKTVDEIKYGGWIGLEVLPEPDPYTAAKDSIDYLRTIKI
jgi:sugar phosphate isomerase/epimerase